MEFTLNVGDKLYIGSDILIQHLQKTHPKAIHAQMVRLGIEVPDDTNVRRGELKALYL